MLVPHHTNDRNDRPMMHAPTLAGLLGLTCALAAQDSGIDRLTAQLQWSQDPPRSTAAVVVMPTVGDRIELAFDAHSRLQLQRRDEGGATSKRAAFLISVPGPFTARAMSPHEILVAMDTSNASSEATVFAFVRDGADAEFVLVGQAVLRQIAWKDRDSGAELSQGPDFAKVVCWDRAALTAQVAFAWRGAPQVVLGEVALGDMRPREVEQQGQRLRTHPMPRFVEVRGQPLGAVGGTDVECAEADGSLLAFVRQQPTAMRRAPVRLCVRDREGTWTSSRQDLPGILVEPGFVVWRDDRGAVHLTTPLSIYAGGQLRQSLRTYRWDPTHDRDSGVVAAQFGWAGRLQQGTPLQMVRAADGAPTIVLQQEDGEIVTCAQDR
ncbi:MAG: hypothetical protein H6838_09950 [Planctomycetes bacterium]|nr:hypothetical protein [Planctomycetota bacterium]MCB9885806.1 hypothetical protein [Planctomycetota bacterium]